MATKKRNKMLTRSKENTVDIFGWMSFLILIIITVISCPTDWTHVSNVSLQHIWFFGWLTAISTGFGAIPFIFVSEPSKYWVGISNGTSFVNFQAVSITHKKFGCLGLAGGMMLAASYCLAHEGFSFSGDSDIDILPSLSPIICTVVGFGSGIIFIIATKKILEQFEDLNFGNMNNVDARKMILIVFVMTLHSITEGIGIGVSFGGKSGLQLGQFISLSLAVHNVPEGLAVALVMNQKKVSVLRSSLWAVFTSLPQPLMAIPAFLFVGAFAPFLPIGLGFASGAMSYVAVFELIIEAFQDTSFIVTGVVSSLSCMLMILIQETMKVSTI